MRRCRWSQTQLSAARWVLLLQLLLPVQLLGSAPAAHHRSGAAAHPSAHQHERRLAAQKAADTQSVIGTHTDLDAAVAAHGTEGHWGQRQLAMAAGAASQGGTGFTTFGAATGATVSWASRAGGAAAADAAGQAAVAPKPSHCREDLPGCCPKELKREWPWCEHAAPAAAASATFVVDAECPCAYSCMRWASLCQCTLQALAQAPVCVPGTWHFSRADGYTLGRRLLQHPRGYAQYV